MKSLRFVNPVDSLSSFPTPLEVVIHVQQPSHQPSQVDPGRHHLNLYDTVQSSRQFQWAELHSTTQHPASLDTLMDSF